MRIEKEYFNEKIKGFEEQMVIMQSIKSDLTDLKKTCNTQYDEMSKSLEST